jgi:hypothetical protein
VDHAAAKRSAAREYLEEFSFPHQWFGLSELIGHLLNVPDDISLGTLCESHFNETIPIRVSFSVKTRNSIQQSGSAFQLGDDFSGRKGMSNGFGFGLLP